MCQAVKGSDMKSLSVCWKIIVFKCEIETRRMDILCIFVSAEKLNFILNPFTLLMSRISVEDFKSKISCFTQPGPRPTSSPVKSLKMLQQL